ncbi:hexaprenyl pyrophosphate synthetase, mitochondrial precursor [Pseudozyma hubeiensis SY62]|uniref:Hexaprenyl pyrophosphate synthetase, mitochondrial n=1 Tax=Pseudozyma hubeiensis (strain SY62) TaxID=1305764 RepID=R9PEI9_PSEHS|nr:hexaprenyl pyrophosphate synthetase, mitochondrial precursor [Pseudozyma hubeiensis SY62]GAC99778.1 hexaprenyl pyrophosphate synthetase, mitochondrial precursor [Pseudozyma hubeiensis SY62]
MAASIETPSPSRDRQGRYGVATREIRVPSMQERKKLVTVAGECGGESLAVTNSVDFDVEDEARFDPIPPPFGPCPTENRTVDLVLVAAAIDASFVPFQRRTVLVFRLRDRRNALNP